MRTEYPRPQFVRDNDWQVLNGQWAFAFDDEDQGQLAHWHQAKLPGDRKITVPFVYQAELSGINDQTAHDVVWYQRELTLTPKPGDRYLLHFGAVDYFAAVYVNDTLVGEHEGGDVGFDLDITAALNPSGAQRLTVRAADRATDETLPRGKQSWTGQSEGIWYTNSTGIWQPVWLEAVPQSALTAVRFTPDVDHMAVTIAADLADTQPTDRLNYTISYQGTVVAEDSLAATTTPLTRTVDLGQQHIFRTSFHDDGWTWTPEHPNLFDVTFTLTRGETVLDRVSAYFGLRKVSRENGMIFLNNRPYYQRLVLDQGYWPDGLLTAPSDDALRADIELAKKMGFNGCRKHQKVEDPRFLYWADKLGYLVWEEVASVPMFAPTAITRLTNAWLAAVQRDYNHPSIIMWVPLNESWGVPIIHHDAAQQHFASGLHHLLKALDPTRLVAANDGWDNSDTDVIGLHNYDHGETADSLKYQRYQHTMATRQGLLTQPASGHAIFAQGFHDAGQPVVLTEFGGVSYDVTHADGWGYTVATSGEQYLAELHRILAPVLASAGLWGFCYTQLADCQQEVNGLLTAAREPKLPLEDLHGVFTGERALQRLNDPE